MAGSQETGVAACVHVQQVTGAGPLVAVGRLLGRGRTAGEPGALEHLPDGRVREAGRAGNEPRSPAGLAAAVADPLLELRGEQAGRAVRPARAVEQRTLLAAAIEPAVPPAVRGRR